jgi:hypothetical protein
VEFEVRDDAMAKLYWAVKLALKSPKAQGCQHQRGAARCHDAEIDTAVEVEEEEQELLTDRLRDDFDCVEAYDSDELVEGIASEYQRSSNSSSLTTYLFICLLLMMMMMMILDRPTLLL